MKKWQKDDVYEWLGEYLYDPWTEDVSRERIKKDVKEKPITIIYGLIAKIIELDSDYQYTSRR